MTRKLLWAILVGCGLKVGICVPLSAQSSGGVGPVQTPRPFDPGENTTNPSALATQAQNPFLGSVPSVVVVVGELPLSLHDAVERALHANLGLIDAQQDLSGARAARVRSLAAFLPQLSAGLSGEFRNLSEDPYGAIKIGGPRILPGFNVQEAHIYLQQHVVDVGAAHNARSAKLELQANNEILADARNIVVLAATSSYLLAAAAQVQLDSAKAELEASSSLNEIELAQPQEESDRELNNLRNRVLRRSAEQRVALAEASIQKSKLALNRIIGLPQEQQIALTDTLDFHPLPSVDLKALITVALNHRKDLQAAQSRVEAAEANVKAQAAERLPSLSLAANAGETGLNVAQGRGDYDVVARLSIPLSTGGRIRADIDGARAVLERRKAELADIRARVMYDVQTAYSDMTTAQSSVEIASDALELATQTRRVIDLKHSQGLSNSENVIEAKRSLSEAEANRLTSVYAHGVAKLMLLRSTGTAEQDYDHLFGAGTSR